MEWTLSGLKGCLDPQEARRKLDLPEAPTVVCTGHLYAGRGVELFVELAKPFPMRNSCGWEAALGMLEAWKSQVAEMGLDNIAFRDLFQTSNCLFTRLPLIFAHALRQKITGSSGGDSSEYCSPMKMFDYLAAGRAIVTSDLPVFHEVLNERNAVFCPPEDVPCVDRRCPRPVGRPCSSRSIGLASQAGFPAIFVDGTGKTSAGWF